MGQRLDAPHGAIAPGMEIQAPNDKLVFRLPWSSEQQAAIAFVP